jgi:hypothetical protein
MLASSGPENATDEDLKADYQEALAYIQARIDDERCEQDEEDDDGW